MTAQPDSASDQHKRAIIGVVLVHGIGAQKRGETLEKFLKGLRRVFPEAMPNDIREGAPVELGNSTLRFYEAYWADLLMGDNARGSFLIDTLPGYAWFPVLNRWRKLYKKGDYSLLRVLWWTLFLPVISLLVFTAIYGTTWIAKSLGEPILGKRRPANSVPDGASPLQRLKAKLVAEANRPLQAYTVVDSLLDEYAGDVFAYVNSAGKATWRPEKKPPISPESQRAFDDVTNRFRRTLVGASGDGCTRICVVAHSLGTVVAYHGLFGLIDRLDDDPTLAEFDHARSDVKQLYTIGSPLEKIRFFWPALMNPTKLGSEVRLRWFNFVSFFDPVAGYLHRFGDWGGVENHRLLGGGFVRGHVLYERSEVFLRSFAKNTLRERISHERSLSEQIKDTVILIGETVLTPALLLFATLAGALLFASATALIAALLALMALPFNSAGFWPAFNNVVGYVAGVYGVLYVLTSIYFGLCSHSADWVRSTMSKPEP